MSNPAESIALSPLTLGEVFLASAVTMQRQIADSVLAVFDAVADAMSDSLHAGAKLADDIGHAETPVDVAAAGCSWVQGRVEKSLTWFRALVERLAHRSGAAAPQAALPVPIERAPVMPQQDIRMPTKPAAGKIRQAPIVVPRMAKKSARPTAK